jgi:asparagine synthase (glutamine-hydrolysing)
MIGSVPIGVGNRVGAMFGAGKILNDRLGDRFRKAAEILRATDPGSLYRQLTCHWKNADDVVVGASTPNSPEEAPDGDEFEHWMMLIDALEYLPDDILVKVDRAAMAVGLETRVPLLDHRIVEFAWTLPLSMKVQHGRRKHVLRELLRRYVPDSLVERPKMGFGVPIGDWLRGPLKEWAEALLDPLRLRAEGYLQPEPIRRKWIEHLSGVRNWQYHLWDVLMFQLWNERQRFQRT